MTDRLRPALAWRGRHATSRIPTPAPVMHGCER